MNECFCNLLMTALYRSGQAAASRLVPRLASVSY